METILKTMVLLLGTCLTVCLVSHITSHRFEMLRNQKTTMEGDTSEVVTKQLDCLAMNVYKEAGTEPFEGKVAVAQVTINRANDSSHRFGNKICDVVYQKSTFMGYIVCQFSWHCDNVKVPINNEMYKESYAVAKKVYLEGFRLEDLNTALYYHADYINPNWHLKKIASIGHHVFYEG